MKAFEQADESDDPSMRLCFEYLQFHSYDRQLYDDLVKRKWETE